ncbi:MAG: DUF6807 family protein [Thermoguttaceae bacterium]
MTRLLSQTALTIALLACLSARSVDAAEQTHPFTVEAGDHDRSNTPVTVLLPAAKNGGSVTLTDAAGNRIPAQLTAPGLLNEHHDDLCELHFILPSLKKGQSMKFSAVVSDAAPGDGFAWKDTPGKYRELSYDEKPVLRYMYEALDESRREETYKVFHHLYNPAGTRFATKGHGGQFTHHRGIFFGFNRVSYEGGKADTWHCSGDAHLSHEGFLAAEAGPVLGRHQVAVDWHGSPKRVFAKERRELTVYHMPGGHLVEFASRLATAGGKVKLDGDPQHAGFQFRAAQEVAAGDQKSTYYLRTDGKGAPGETRNWSKGNDQCADLPFNAMSFVIDGNRYTAVYLDSPSNPKEARYSERSYGRFGSYFEYELDEDKDLVINYRIWLQDGEMTIEQVAALSADFVEPPTWTRQSLFAPRKDVPKKYSSSDPL